MRVTILGAGGSSGTPAADGDWGRCDPAEPRNRRTRPSILIEEGDRLFLVDTAPDLRQQLLAAGRARLTAVFYTHAHADHVHGIDDLRAVNRHIDRVLDAFGDVATLMQIRQRFGYAFEPLDPRARTFYKPTLLPHVIEPGRTLEIAGVPVTPFDQDHGFSRTLGFRFGPIAYSTDVVELSEAAFQLLRGVRVWIIGTLVARPHPTHCHVGKALQWIDRVAPDRAALTHLGNDLDYQTLAAQVPAGVEPAHDGLTMSVEE